MRIFRSSLNEFLVGASACVVLVAPAFAGELARYEPPDGKVLVFVGQDNRSVGGNGNYRDGYIDTIGVPAGITHYIPFNHTDPDVPMPGLQVETEWGAGPMCMQCYLDSPTLEGTIAHLSIWLGDGALEPTANGEREATIGILADFLKQYSDVPFLLRIGYEFDNAGYGYDPELFVRAWRNIVDGLHARSVDNFATVLSSVRIHTSREAWEAYWPGDEYVDWIGYTYWYGASRKTIAFDIAREKGKPIFISEATPRHRYLDENHHISAMHWEDWFQPFFDHIEENPDIVKAISYINSDWDAEVMWDHWGDTRIQENPHVHERWNEKMSESTYVNRSDDPYGMIGFRAERENDERE